MEITKEDGKYLKAKKRVNNIKMFYTNSMMYMMFICALAGLNYYLNEFRNPWFLWAAFGWGIGLFFQAIKVFNWTPFMGRNWEERKIKEIMEEEEKNNTNWN